ncbi:SIMPL domain-containing protein [Candidatus Peregrinibacteria bacterium]|nr:SIMPL domain-containing protein [Candidatus Peregrinibacteria bacterium]MBT7736484.1 SIMPL domain-containing protein [Candidatus Peregrinibacteria bacterium]
MAKEKFDLSNRVFALVTAIVVGLVIYWGFSIYDMWAVNNGDYPREISVEGEGTAYVVPDVAETSIGIYVQGATAIDVTEEGTEKMNAIVEAIKEEGVDEEDIQTTDYYLGPNYNWSQEKGSYADGFYLDQTVEVKIRDFEMVGAVLAASTDAGANSNTGINFVIDDPEVAKEDARKEAIAQAKEKAGQIAEASGLKLGKLLNYYEYDDYYGHDDYDSYYAEPYMMDYGVEEAVSLAAPSIEPGQEEVTVSVTLTYRIK